MERIKATLKNKSGEGHIDTAVKIIIAVVIGALLLGGLYLLFSNVILPQLDTEVGDMMDYGENGTTVRRTLDDATGTYVLEYSYDGKHWQGVEMPNYGTGSSVYQLISGGESGNEQAALVRSGSTYYLIASADGIKWTEQFNFTANSITHFYYGTSSQLPRGAGSFSGEKFVVRWHSGGQTYFTGVAANATKWSKPTWSDKATVAAVKATVAAVKGIVAAIAAGGWIAVVIIVVICIIAMAVGAVFSIFTPGKGDLSLNQVIFETENEYAEQMEIYKANIPHDYIKIRGEPTAWKEALAVYMVKYKIDGEDREDVTSFTKKQAGKLKQVYRDFNTVLVTLEERTEPYTHLVQNENGEWVEVTEDRTVTDLVFTYHTATVDEIMDKYKFNKRKRQALQDLFRPDFDVLWNALFIESP